MASSSTSESPEPSRGATSKAFTPPKGRPTRGRDDVLMRRRVFGPVAQWIAVAIVVVIVVAFLIWVTGGGVFNPFDTDHTGSIALAAAHAGLA